MISGPRSVLPEPDPNHRYRWAAHIIGGAVLEYGPTEILPPVGPMLPRPARLCRPRRPPRPTHPRKTAADRASAIRSAASSPTSSPAVRYWNTARQRYHRLSARYSRAPRVSAEPRPLVPPRTTAESRGFSTYKGEFPRETGSHLTPRWREPDSNPSVPRPRKVRE